MDTRFPGGAPLQRFLQRFVAWPIHRSCRCRPLGSHRIPLPRPPSNTPSLSCGLLLWVSLPGPCPAIAVGSRPPSARKIFVAFTTPLPAGFEVRRFVRVLSLESAPLARCLVNGALRLPLASYPPACAGESDARSGRLATSRRHLPAGSPAVGSAVTGDLAAVGPRREPLFALAREKSPRSSAGRPGAARLKGRRFRPALPASLDFLSLSPKSL